MGDLGRLWDWICSKWKWIKEKTPELFVIVLFTVIITFIMSGFLSLFPLPAPEMDIQRPLNYQLINVPEAGPDGRYNGTIIDVNITIHSGRLRNIIYDWEITQRWIKILDWDPKIWVMARKGDEVEVTPILKVENFANGFANVPITLYVPAEWDIELLSLNAKDDEYITNYLAAVENLRMYPQPIDRPYSSYPIDKVRIITYTETVDDYINSSSS